MKFIVLSASILALSASVALADPIADRKAQMKARGALVGELAPIARGQQPYDAAKVLATLEEMSKNAETDVSVLWPAGSEAGDHTSSLKVWEDPSAFEAAVDKYKSDVDAAVAANPQDIDAFRPLFGAITSNCGACHEDFRVKRG
ncbi:c-type cytochrome [Mesorhizobium australicum]|uniref:Cytochrome c556 n=1 Tax=Mesorhizobium australicum TaxID=536018 RepID=A0A1X7NV24_9HYPH|nr:cytochrome c [Mesorhizobium australicum]SMH42093.1 Cytochrome c556 [Mesorhizobium australicum]